MMFAVTLFIGIPLYIASVLVAVWDRVDVWVPSMAVSSTAVTVTVCGVLKSEEVNVSGVGLTVVSPSVVIAMVTSALGALSRTTV